MLVPTYDYKCTRCGHTFSVEQSITDKPLVRCKKCRGKLEKLLPRSINLIFKGSGFYVTDYKRSKTEGPATEPNKRAASGGEAKPDAVESKSASAGKGTVSD
jgi:putative FmdB family regulatory protein